MASSIPVVGRLGLTAIDGGDPDKEPDKLWCTSGTVRFTPVNTNTRVFSSDGSPWTAGHGMIPIPVDSSGFLSWQGSRYVLMLDYTSDDYNPSVEDGKSTHRVQFNTMKTDDGTIVAFPDTTARIAADSLTPLDAQGAADYGLPIGTLVYDITKGLPVPAAGGSPITVGRQGVGVEDVVQPTPGTMALTLTNGETTTEIELPVGPGGSDAGVAGYLDDPESLTAQAVTAKIPAPSNAIQDVLGLIEAGTRDVNILAIGDSTVMSVTNAWGLQLASKLAELFPTHTVKRRKWNYGVADEYLAADQTFVGTGPRTITVWLAGAPGRTWAYQVDAARRSLILAASPDLILFDHGHNTYSGADPSEQHRDFAVASIEAMRAEAPQAAILLMSQNPRADAAGVGRAEKMADYYRTISAERGYAFVDICKAFHDDGRSLDTLVNTGETPAVHPTAAGFEIWTNEILAAFRFTTPSQAIPRRPSSFSEGGRNYAPNPTLASDDYAAGIPGWAGTNVTLTKVTSPTYVRNSGKGYVVKVAKTATGNARIVGTLPVKHLAGKVITVVVPEWIPSSGAVPSTGQISLRNSSWAILSAGWTDDAYNRDQWTYRTITYRVPADQATLDLWVTLDIAGGGIGAEIYLDEIFVVEGAYPSASANPAPTAAPTAGTVNVQTFSASGTWTKPSGAKAVSVVVVAPGGGGGSGRRGAADSLRIGGAGGGGGGRGERTFPAGALGDTVAVAIGAPGAGGVAVTVDSTSGNAGGSGGAVTFGSALRIFGGAGGAGGGATAAAAGGAAGTGTTGGSAGASSSATGGDGTNGVSSTAGGPGGASGGGITTANIGGAGGTGGTVTTGSGAGGGTGGADTVAGGNATDSPANSGIPGPSGGGGGASAKGGNGAAYGGGGGGGGASLNGTASGAGGAGGAGICIVTTYF